MTSPGTIVARTWLVLVVAVACASMASSSVLVAAVDTDWTQRLLDGSPAHLLGTNELGQDVLARLVVGGRVSIAVAACSSIASALVGAAVGVLAASARGIVGATLLRLTDAMLALPLLPLLLVLAAVELADLPSSTGSAMRIAALLALTSWAPTARLLHVVATQADATSFVEAARALGAPSSMIVMRHIVPACLPALAVAASQQFGHLLLVEAALSFLGLGVQPPLPTWGSMIAQAVPLLDRAPSLLAWPAACVVATVAALHVVGDHARDRLDVRMPSSAGRLP